MHGADGTRIGDSYRLITTLLDWRRYPAGELIRLYHERWEIEVAYLALRHTLLGGYVLRSRDRAGAEQELWALLAVYQALRMAMTAAAESAGSRPGPGQLHRRAGSRPRPGHRSPRRRGLRQTQATPAGSAVPSWTACCPPAARATAPARSNAPPPATTSATTDRPGPSLPVRDDHPGADHHPGPAPGPSRRAPPPQEPAARSPPALPGQQKRPGHPHHGQPARPGLVRQRTRGQARHKTPRTCSPSSPSGPASASSPRPAAAGTPCLAAGSAGP